MRNKLLSMTFCLLLIAALAFELCLPDQYYSEREKRTLTQKSDISILDFSNGKMSTKLENYLSDQFPLRNQWITLKTLLDDASNAGLDTINVFDTLSLHKDEYLYYKTDHHFTSLGAYYCYVAWMQAQGKVPEPLTDWQSQTLCTDFRGTIYNKVNAQFADYAETHLIDLRFYKDSVSDYIAGNGITQVLVLYNIPNFAQDTAISKTLR